MHINVPWLSRSTAKARKNGRKIQEVHISFVVNNTLKVKIKVRLLLTIFLLQSTLALRTPPLIRTAAKPQAKINYRCLNEINFRYYGPSLMRTLTQCPYSVHHEGS